MNVRTMTIGLAWVCLVAGCGGDRVAVMHVASKMRSGPSLTDKQVAVLPEDGVVDVMGASGDWLEVKSGETPGYVLSCLTSQVKRSKLEEFQARSAEAAKAYAEYEKAARKSDEALAKLADIVSEYGDTKYGVLALKAQFQEKAARGDADALDALSSLNTRCAARVEGDLVEIARQYAAKSGEMKKAVAALAVEETRPAWVAVKEATLRSEPSKSADSTGTVSYGTKVAVQRRFGDYVEVKAGKSSGWVHVVHTTASKPLTVAGSYVIESSRALAFERMSLRQSGSAISGSVFDKRGREFAYKGTISGTRVHFECSQVGRKGCTFNGTIQGDTITGTFVAVGGRDREYEVTFSPSDA